MLATVFKSSRPPFLLLTPACLAPALVLAYQSGVSVSNLHMVLIIIGAMSAHISVNCFNEYFDFKSGLDNLTERTPFSGGSGALIEAPEHLAAVGITAILTLLITAGCGLVFVFQIGWPIAPIGLLGLIIVYAYTRYINRNPWLCLIAPGLAFGPLMMVGSYWVLTKQFNIDILLLSMVPFCLVSNLLLINQIPDIEADKRVGRRTFPIVYGVLGASRAYLMLAILAVMFAFLYVFNYSLNFGWVAVLLSLSVTFVSYAGLRRHLNVIPSLIPFMAMTVTCALLSPLLMALGIYLE